MDADDRKKYIALPTDDSHMCFGCSQGNESGLRMQFYVNEQKDAVVSWLSILEHMCGWGNIAHGGIISTILDEVMAWGGIVLLGRFALTKKLSVEFLAPVQIGEEIKVEANVREVLSKREAVLEASLYQGKKQCAKASSICSLFTSESLKKTGVTDDTTLESIETIMKEMGSGRNN